MKLYRRMTTDLVPGEGRPHTETAQLVLDRCYLVWYMVREEEWMDLDAILTKCHDYFDFNPGLPKDPREYAEDLRLLVAIDLVEDTDVPIPDSMTEALLEGWGANSACIQQQKEQVERVMQILDAGRVFGPDDTEVPTSLEERARNVVQCLRAESQAATEARAELLALKQKLHDLHNTHRHVFWDKVNAALDELYAKMSWHELKKPAWVQPAPPAFTVVWHFEQRAGSPLCGVLEPYEQITSMKPNVNCSSCLCLLAGSPPRYSFNADPAFKPDRTFPKVTVELPSVEVDGKSTARFAKVRWTEWTAPCELHVCISQPEPAPVAAAPAISPIEQAAVPLMDQAGRIERLEEGLLLLLESTNSYAHLTLRDYLHERRKTGSQSAPAPLPEALKAAERCAAICRGMVIGGRAWTEEQRVAAHALLDAAQAIDVEFGLKSPGAPQ